ncbi:hypothetical protein BKA56DRAFT_424379, partial [Ilyonectria sp. MPI-CAGE-AT-0026]
MAIVAVAGGTGKVGRTLVEAIVAAGKHEVKVLARKPNPECEAELGVPIIPVDYSNVEALTKVLEENNVHTVISAQTMLPTPGSGGPKEIELIRAADASKTTKRMISSDWGLPHTEAHAKQLPSVPPRLEAQRELKKTTDLETTHVVNGFFLDYWGVPAFKSHMGPSTMVLDIPNKTAAIPGTGDVPVVFTHTTDVAKYVAASLDLAKWEPVTYIVGDKVTWNEFLHLAEEATGAKFDVVYDSIEKLKGGEVTELPGHVAAYEFFPKHLAQFFYSVFGLWFAEGAFNYEPTKTLNDAFPEIQPLKVKDILD